MTLTPYREVLAAPGVRRLVLFSILFRIPSLATGVALTLHVVTTLGRGYAEAGLVGTAFTLATALGQPVRGRAVDRVGLRRAIAPALVAVAVMYAVIPFVGFWVLLPVIFVCSLVPLPIFTVTRQSLSAMVPVSQRRTAFALDSMGVELSFMAGPALGVLAATRFATTTALMVIGALVVGSGVSLMIFNPPTRAGDAGGREAAAEQPASEGQEVPATGLGSGDRARIRWSPALAIAVAAAVSATVVLAGTDVSIVAFARAHHSLSWTGGVFITWGLGSILGALVYGAMRRPVPILWLVLMLGTLTIPIGLTPNMALLAIAILPAAAACAPVITATANAMAELVPERALGEAMGWHASALTAGTALGAPLAGAAMDRYGPWSGFATVGLAGALLAASGFVVTGLARRRRRADDRIRPRRVAAGSLSD